MTALDAAPCACPAPEARALAASRAPAREEVLLSLPTIHCATCIAAVEDGLARLPGIAEARVNLSLKRVRVRHDGRYTPETLIPAIARLGYEALPLDAGLLSETEAARVARDLALRFGVAFFASMNVMLLSVAVWSGAEDATRTMFYLISGLIAVPTVAWAGQPLFRSAWTALRAGHVNMDVPISVALLLATGLSTYESLHGGHHAYFEAVVMLTALLLAGRWLDQRTRMMARSAAQELAALEVPRAVRVTADGPEPVAVADLAVGDLIRVAPGGRVPVDGVVTDGASETDRSALTGETRPVAVAPGDAVGAGETNLTGALTLCVTAAGRDSSLARMAALVATAEESRSRYTSIADRAARLYAPLVHSLAAVAFAFWVWRTGGDVRVAIGIAAAVLIITCPCALGLAVPAVVTAASGRLFRRGLLIKSGTALERLAEVDAVVFDKTGTLTMGAPEPVGLDVADPGALSVAMALAEGSAHPLAQGLAKAARARRVQPAAVTAIREVPGHGIEGTWQGQPVRLGRAEWLGAAPGETTATHLRIGDATPVTYAFADALRPGAAELVADLRARKIPVHLISGDVAPAVAAFAARLGIDRWRAGLTPAEKSDYVAGLGSRVLMVGDGLNDTAALAAAHVSISPATGLDAARAASDIVLLGSDLSPVADALRIGRLSVRRMRENLLLSAGYNVIAVPIALIGLTTPLIAAIAMSASSITVTLNAMRLR